MISENIEKIEEEERLAIEKDTARCEKLIFIVST